jgi:hypothetical protein
MLTFILRSNLILRLSASLPRRLMDLSGGRGVESLRLIMAVYGVIHRGLRMPIRFNRLLKEG